MEKILEFKGITKTFPGVKALDDINLDLYKGEVHVILGENGAGKSTLMKILAGAYTPDSGEVILDGNKKMERYSPILSEEAGIRMIYQELNLIPELSIQDNIFLGHELKKGVFLDRKKMYKHTKQLLQSLNIDENPRKLVKDLSIAYQQMIEIVRALSSDAKVLVFDEPTSSLTSVEIKELFEMIRKLKKLGVGMFYISHRLEEVFEIGDRVTIMRDGVCVRTENVENITMNEIVEGIAGRKIENLYPHVRKPCGKKLLEISNLTGKRFKNINIEVHAGEIVGLSGLVGAGRSEIARAVFGIDDYADGEVFVDGNKLPKNSTAKAVDSGLCLLPENRKEEGLALSMSVEKNMTIAALNNLLVNNRLLRRETLDYVEKLSIATPTIDRLVNFLSGGTQQKVVVAKWLMTKSKVFIFDEPTRGIDVGAKTDIYELMDMLLEQGAAIIMISSDLPEVLGMSDRIYVICQGEIAGEFEADKVDQNTILQYAFGQQKKEETN
jgi:ribose transport system ATP-binding protein